MSKLTGWYDASINPARPGVYEVDDGDGNAGPWYSHWNGTLFMYRSRDVLDAHDMRNFSSRFRAVQWRGLSRRPK